MLLSWGRRDVIFTAGENSTVSHSHFQFTGIALYIVPVNDKLQYIVDNTAARLSS